MLEKATLKFLKDLKKNNNKPWFDAHRAEYEQAKNNVLQLAEYTLQALTKIDSRYGELEAKKCLFRINRDVRFSKNKEPYKHNIGAGFSIGGKNSANAGFYIHIEPAAHFVGGGLWQPEPEALKKIRQEIDYQFKEFKSIVESKKFTSVYGGLSMNDSLVNPPKGYNSDNPAIQYLKLKSFVAGKSFSDNDMMDIQFPKQLKNCLETMAPLIQFLNQSME